MTLLLDEQVCLSCGLLKTCRKATGPMVADLAGCAEHLPTNAPTLSARCHVLAVLGPWAMTATPNPQRKPGEVMEAEPRTPRGVLAKIARITKAVPAQRSFKLTPAELVDEIGDLALGHDLAAIKDDLAALLEVLTDVMAEYGGESGEAPAAAAAPARGRGRAAEPEPEEPPARRGRGGGAPKEPVKAAPPARGRGRAAEPEEPEDDDQSEETEETEEEAPARGRGRGAPKEPAKAAAAPARGRGRAAEPEPEGPPARRGRGGASSTKEPEPEPAGRGARGRGRAAEPEPEAPPEAAPEGRRGRGARGADAAPSAPAFDASALEADIAALRVDIASKADAKLVGSIVDDLPSILANQNALDRALTLVVNELFFTDNKTGKLTKDAVESVLGIDDIEAYVFPE